MPPLSPDYIRTAIADSEAIYSRGVQLCAHGAFVPMRIDTQAGQYEFIVDGNYGDYDTRVDLSQETPVTRCDCPYPGEGCKHIVAILLYAHQLRTKEEKARRSKERAAAVEAAAADDRYLTAEEIRAQALKDRENRARREEFSIEAGEMFKGTHEVSAPSGQAYTVTLHDPVQGAGHCSCPDFLTNRLGTCKHLLFAVAALKKKKGFPKRVATEAFPFIDIYWDSVANAPRVFSELPQQTTRREREILARCFDEAGRFTAARLGDLMKILPALDDDKRVRIQPEVLRRLEFHLEEEGLAAAAATADKHPPLPLKVELYPYQREGVRFALYRSAALIGDEMGLGKTLQAIAVALLKQAHFGFKKVLVVTLASLKEQWRREIGRFSDATAVVVAGPARQRRAVYREDPALFKITNYEAVLRDVDVIADFAPDLVILDEAQRIKNFNTKTAAAIKRLPRRHALVLTGTPLENRLEDIYSIAQFLDPHLLSPLWRFAADHFMLSRTKKNKIEGYRNLERLNQKLKELVLRRRKEEVLKELPDQVVNTYFVEMTPEQQELHASYAARLAPLLHKKYLTPMDLRRIQELLLRMRQACNATYLIDRTTHISPKLDELANLLDELVIASGRKLVLFSEWTTMTYLIARRLSEAGIGFVELSGKVPVPKRQALIDTFTNDDDCRVFLSTDAGGTGLNLQAADCVVNFELPWNPARLNQRIGRVNRIGQRSRCINVVNWSPAAASKSASWPACSSSSTFLKAFSKGGPTP
jgi:hypothetical protein